MQQADAGGNSGKKTSTSQSTSSLEFSVSEIPAYSGELYTVVHDNVPYFSEDELTTEAFEDYSPLDDLGRWVNCYKQRVHHAVQGADGQREQLCKRPHLHCDNSGHRGTGRYSHHQRQRRECGLWKQPCGDPDGRAEL